MQIGAWAHRNQIIKISQITPEVLDRWKSWWSPKAKHPDDRIGKTTAGRRLEKVKGFLFYCVKMRWIIKSPATDLKAIKPDESVTLPLLSGRYEKVIAATYARTGAPRSTSSLLRRSLAYSTDVESW
jgi:hypothetical protein